MLGQLSSYLMGAILSFMGLIHDSFQTFFGYAQKSQFKGYLSVHLLSCMIYCPSFDLNSFIFFIGIYYNNSQPCSFEILRTIYKTLSILEFSLGSYHTLFMSSLLTTSREQLNTTTKSAKALAFMEDLGINLVSYSPNSIVICANLLTISGFVKILFSGC